VSDVDQLVLKRLRRGLAKDYAPNTIKLTMAYAGMILRAAHTSGRIPRDPTAELREKKRRAGEKDDRVRPQDVPTRAEAFYSSAWRPALRPAGLGDRFKVHACRHWCASTLLAEDAPIRPYPGTWGHRGDGQSRVRALAPDDRDIPADVLDRVLAPADDALQARDQASDGES
jgi:hypothetical protein